MARYAITPDVALLLAERGAAIPADRKLLAPTLLRSQLLAMLYDGTRRGAIPRTEADRRLDYLRTLRIRLLGDPVLQRSA